MFAFYAGSELSVVLMLENYNARRTKVRKLTPSKALKLNFDAEFRKEFCCDSVWPTTNVRTNRETSPDSVLQSRRSVSLEAFKEKQFPTDVCFWKRKMEK